MHGLMGISYTSAFALLRFSAANTFNFFFSLASHIPSGFGCFFSWEKLLKHSKRKQMRCLIWSSFFISFPSKNEFGYLCIAVPVRSLMTTNTTLLMVTYMHSANRHSGCFTQQLIAHVQRSTSHQLIQWLQSLFLIHCENGWACCRSIQATGILTPTPGESMLYTKHYLHITRWQKKKTAIKTTQAGSAGILASVENL